MTMTRMLGREWMPDVQNNRSGRRVRCTAAAADDDGKKRAFLRNILSYKTTNIYRSYQNENFYEKRLKRKTSVLGWGE